MRLEDEIQTKKFVSPQQKAFLNIIFTASWLNGLVAQWLKPFDITHQQYNILRILNGQDKPISIIDIKGRMLDRMSNVSRLVEKLRLKGYAQRVECLTDRRLVEISITDSGRKLLKTMTEDMPVHLRFTDALSDEQAHTLSDLLDQMRSAAPQFDFENSED